MDPGLVSGQIGVPTAKYFERNSSRSSASQLAEPLRFSAARRTSGGSEFLCAGSLGLGMGSAGPDGLMGSQLDYR